MKWFSRNEDECDSLRLERKGLRKECDELKRKVKDLTLDKKISEEDIKHMVKLKLEAADVATEKKELKLQRASDKKVMDIKLEYQNKTEKGLQEQLKDLKSMYESVLQRLPDVNVKLQGKVG